MNTNKLNVLLADKNKYFATKDKTKCFGKEICLGIYDDASNYIQVDEETRNEIIKANELKEKLLEEESSFIDEEIS